jgi:ketosteroid isomerase-like protein
MLLAIHENRTVIYNKEAAMKTTILLLSFFTFSLTFAQDKSDMDAINKVLDQYLQTEIAGNMMAQANLMTPDRIWIGQGQGRRTNQQLNMQLQQAQIDEEKKLVPGLKVFIDERDRIVRFYGNGTVAVASFYWYTTYIVPASTPPEIVKMFNTPVPPSVFTLVLVKEQGDWKIAHTHESDLFHAEED